MTFPELVQKLTNDSLEIAKTEPGFGYDYDNFLAVMWENDDDLKRCGVDRETYAEALREAWVAVF
jgi:hypothetical protein